MRLEKSPHSHRTRHSPGRDCALPYRESEGHPTRAQAAVASLCGATGFNLSWSPLLREGIFVILEMLTTSLLDLVERLGDFGEPLTLGGGFGLYLKQVDLETRPGVETLIPVELWPPARATEDIDLILGTEIVISLPRMRTLRSTLDSLGFESVVDFMQFEKKTAQGTVKIDLLTGPIEPDERLADVKVKGMRVRPKGSVRLHAYRTPEALLPSAGATIVTVHGVTSKGQPSRAQIRIPGSFTLLLMKLHAFRDRLEDARKQLAQHHALDIYRIDARSAMTAVGIRRRRRASRTSSPSALRARRTGMGISHQIHRAIDARLNASGP